jgi:hypothetical protein
MARVITSITFDLKYNVSTTPPTVQVTFADVAADGNETHGRTAIHDAEASALFPPTLLAAVNAAIDAQAALVAEPGSVAARVQAAADAETLTRAAVAATKEAKAELARINAEIAAKTPETR